MKPPKKAIRPMMIRNRPCNASKATTITFPGGGCFRHICNDGSVSMDGILLCEIPGPGGTSLQAASNLMYGADTGGGYICWSNPLFCHERRLLKGHLFWGELFGMLIFPPAPEGHDDLLERASHRDSQEPAQQSEEFCAREEREQSHDGMHSHGFAED